MDWSKKERVVYRRLKFLNFKCLGMWMVFCLS